MSRSLRAAVLSALLAFPIAGQRSPHSPAEVPFVPVEVFQAKTIAVAVYWPGANWREKAAVQADGERFLRHWKRYQVVRISEGPDLVALVSVEPSAASGGFWRTLAYALAAGAQAYAQSAQNYARCQGSVSESGRIEATCYGYQPAPAEPQPPPPPRYVLAGSILVFDGKFLRTGAPIPEPLLFANAENRGSRPLIGAAKRLRTIVEQGEKALAERMATVDALKAKVHELAAASHLPEADEAECTGKIAQQIGASAEMLHRLEGRDFADVERFFPALCGPGQK